jgi:maltooligosyltrehalose synthase
MTSIQINITINEEALRVRAIKTYQQAKKAAINYCNQACDKADAFARRQSTQTVMAKLSLVLRNKPTEWPKHTIFCDCRRCKPLNIRTYCRKIQAL